MFLNLFFHTGTGDQMEIKQEATVQRSVLNFKEGFSLWRDTRTFLVPTMLLGAERQR